MCFHHMECIRNVWKLRNYTFLHECFTGTFHEQQSPWSQGDRGGLRLPRAPSRERGLDEVRAVRHEALAERRGLVAGSHGHLTGHGRQSKNHNIHTRCVFFRGMRNAVRARGACHERGRDETLGKASDTSADAAVHFWMRLRNLATEKRIWLGRPYGTY